MKWFNHSLTFPLRGDRLIDSHHSSYRSFCAWSVCTGRMVGPEVMTQTERSRTGERMAVICSVEARKIQRKKGCIFFLMLARSWFAFICSCRTFSRNWAEVRGDFWSTALISVGCMDICASSQSQIHGLSQDLRLPVVKSCWDGGKTEGQLALLPVFSNYWVTVPKIFPGCYPRQPRRIYTWRQIKRIISSLGKCGSASWYSWGSLGKTCSLLLSLKGRRHLFHRLA